MKILKKILNDFALDLINHCASIKDGEIVLPEEGLHNLINSYLETDDPVIWPITLEMIQEEADQELERPLTEIELNRLNLVFFDNLDTSWRMMVLIREAIEEAVDNSKHQWGEVDKDFKEEKLKEVNK